MNKVMNRGVQMFIIPKEEENIRPRRGRTLHWYLRVKHIIPSGLKNKNLGVLARDVSLKPQSRKEKVI
ncbi:MAG: hypothetical protein B6D61_10105 [Bacteroidetes bacterium 4484_249]|nr:MAG: hypothetical protein B6D61_10105 [Bacteroidetes bacterium 4484_249]